MIGEFLRVAHAPRVSASRTDSSRGELAMASRDRGLFSGACIREKACFSETPKVRAGLAFTRETRALPNPLSRA
jgi:hypothetical protein